MIPQDENTRIFFYCDYYYYYLCLLLVLLLLLLLLSPSLYLRLANYFFVCIIRIKSFEEEINRKSDTLYVVSFRRVSIVFWKSCITNCIGLAKAGPSTHNPLSFFYL